MSKSARPSTLDAAAMARGLRWLARRDPDLGRILEDYGPPRMWWRAPGFPSLVYIILEQMVSLASAKAVYERLRVAASPLSPARLLELDDATLRAAGFSRQKTASVRDLARALVEGRLNLKALEVMSDEEVRAELLQVKGIGRWTADIYLLRSLRRTDVWPAGDLALAVAAERVKRLPARPTPRELDALGESWRPWRSVAARLLWQFYLHAPKRR